MPSTQSAYIQLLINNFVKNYAAESFHDGHMTQILSLLNQLADSGGGGGITNYQALQVTSADFINATDCPIVGYNGLNILVHWADIPKSLINGVDVQALVGGGFQILIPGFNSGAGTFTFWVFITL